MKKILAIAVVVVLVLFYINQGRSFDDEYDFAKTIASEIDKAEYSFTLEYDNDFDIDYAFAVLESIMPYSFSADIKVQSINTVDIVITIPNYDKQKQGVEMAAALAEALSDDTMTDKEKIVKFHNYIVMNTVYDSQLAEEHSGEETSAFWAYGALVEGKAVCAGYSRALSAMALSQGIDIMYVVSEVMNHGWNAVMLDGEIYHIDATFNDPVPDRGKEVQTTYLLVKSGTIPSTYKFNEEFLEKVLTNCF